MPEVARLEAEPRPERGTKAARRLRRAGRLPVVLYGHKQETVSLSVPLAQFEAILRSGARMVDLDIQGRAERALLKDIQFDSLGDQILHADFIRVAMDEAVEVTVPLELVGTPAGVREGGTLDQVLHEITITCLPQNMPERIRVRVEELGLGQTLHAGEIPLPEGITLAEEPETPVATVHPPVSEEEMAAEEEEGPAAPEVIRRESRREEEEEGGE